MSEEKKQSVQDIVEEVSADICNNYCKYPLIMDTEEMLDEICDNCPLTRL